MNPYRDRAPLGDFREVRSYVLQMPQLMTTEHHPIRNGIIIGVSSIVLGAGILWGFGKLSVIWKVVVAVLSDVVGLLQTPIPLWTWLVGVGLSVIAISTRRRLVARLEQRRTAKAERAAIIGDALNRSINESVNKIHELATEVEAKIESVGAEEEQPDISNEPKVEEAKIENLVAEEYDDEEEEEDWRSYTTDNILDIDWRWRWHGTSIESLTAHCPDCDFELRPETTTMVTGMQWLNGFRCEDEECGWSVATPSQYETCDVLHDYVKKHVRRDARMTGYPG